MKTPDDYAGELFRVEEEDDGWPEAGRLWAVYLTGPTVPAGLCVATAHNPAAADGLAGHLREAVAVLVARAQQDALDARLPRLAGADLSRERLAEIRALAAKFCRPGSTQRLPAITLAYRVPDLLRYVELLQTLLSDALGENARYRQGYFDGQEAMRERAAGVVLSGEIQGIRGLCLEEPLS